MHPPKKLIEVALPLDDINRACVREKSIRHGHPSTLHLWWARRPLAAARAVIWASLVDDPSAHPEKFATEEEQSAERERLFGILRELVVWENSNSREILAAARAEMLASCGGSLPALLDPFMGGGAIPLEAQRLGLKSYGADLNPVAVTINKAMLEVPPRFHGQKPVNPSAASSADSLWPGTQGLADDVAYYGGLLKKMAQERLIRLYPKASWKNAQTGEREERTVIAWLWARTVRCPNPACGCRMPLANSFVLSKKKGNEAWVEPIIDGKEISYKVHERSKCPKEVATIKAEKAATFRCVRCGAVAGTDYIHGEFKKKAQGERLMAIVAEGEHGRLYISPTREQEELALNVPEPADAPQELMDEETPNLVSGRGFGITHWKELFTHRQLTLLTTLVALLPEVRKEVERDAEGKLADDTRRLEAGGAGAAAYAEAVTVFLAFVIDRTANFNSSFCSWDNIGEKLRNIFGRQAIPMVWDYTEVNPFSNSSGSYSNMLGWVVEAVQGLPQEGEAGQAVQWDASKDNALRDVMVSTDPPYYDNICYSDLSDFFYIWLKESLKGVFPSIFTGKAVPKAEELVAMPYRFGGGKKDAKDFFEGGMALACKNIFEYSREDVPATIYYAFKQSEIDPTGKASTAWETMLSAIIDSGFIITGTWPMNTEMGHRNVATGANALASSIVIVCRKPAEPKREAPFTAFSEELKREVLAAVRKMQEASISPVDLRQAAIGPGIAVFSRYSSIIYADSGELSVRDALKQINRVLDAQLDELAARIDAPSSLCLDMYAQAGFGPLKFGAAQKMANARNIAVESVGKAGAAKVAGGVAQLIPREELPALAPAPAHPMAWLNTQQCVKACMEGGTEAAAQALALLSGTEAGEVKDLCYPLYDIAERNGWHDDAFAYNVLIGIWDEAEMRARKKKAAEPKQGEFSY